MNQLKRITNDELVIAILSLWYGIPVRDVLKICKKLNRKRKEPPGKIKKLPELERIATECVILYRK